MTVFYWSGVCERLLRRLEEKKGRNIRKKSNMRKKVSVYKRKKKLISMEYEKKYYTTRYGNR